MKNFELLVPTRCLTLLFYNFTQEDIKVLSEVREFEHAWQKYCLGPWEQRQKKKKSNGLINHIPDTDFYNLYNNVSYKTQLAILERAMERYSDEVCRNIGCSLKLMETYEEEKKKIIGTMETVGFKRIDTPEISGSTNAGGTSDADSGL